MPIVYEQADEEIGREAEQIMRRFHPELKLPPDDDNPDGAYPRLCILMATSSDGEQAVKCHGDPAAAVISIIPYKQRVDKRADAEIIIDALVWEGLNPRQRQALLDHEITHLQVLVDDGGFVKTDDTGRPKLRLRQHDWTLSGFRSIADRYGEDALEVMEARHFARTYGDVTRVRERSAGRADWAEAAEEVAGRAASPSAVQAMADRLAGSGINSVSMTGGRTVTAEVP